MKSKHLVGIITGVILGVSLTATIIGCSNNNAERKYSPSKIKLINKLLQHSYLREIDDKKVEDSIYAGYVSGLEDPVTSYLNEERLKEQQVLQEGKYIGTGLQFEWGFNGRYIIVTDIIPNSPASLENIKIGDKITEIDAIKVMLSNETELYEKLMYTGDKAVIYTVQDNNESNERKVSLNAKVIDIKSMTHKMIDNNIGYITLFSIKSDASQEIQKNINDLKASGAKKFIIDIRNVYSNNIEEIYRMCQLFINEKDVFKIKNKQGEMKAYKTKEALYDDAVVVLINGRTKGALEAFASAIKDTARGKVIGEKSAGIGRINEIISLDDKSGLMVSTGIIYNSSESSLADKGVLPDIEVKSDVQSVVELITTGRLDEKHDLQLMEAIKQLR